jgi:hypothetical protein
MWYDVEMMADKLDGKQDYLNKNITKIWCPDRDNFQYIKVCDSNCKKNTNVRHLKIILNQNCSERISSLSV